jgi:uncharacterized alpha-E superfamily protein
MLSRVAENLFWIGRYIERAENTARLLDVNYYATLETGGLVTEQWAPLVAITGSDDEFRKRGERADGRSVPNWLAFAPENPSSIRACITQARENARVLRDRISSEMWECINRAYHKLSFGTEFVLPNDSLHDYCIEAREASHLFFGIAFATLPREEGWQFLRAGQKLERGDNILRLLQVRYRRSGKEAVAEAIENHRWMAVLKTASAYEAYRKRYQTRLEPRRIAEFLLLNPTFPRSVRYCADSLRGSLEAIAAENPGQRKDALREIGWLAARLEYATIDSILDKNNPSLDALLEEFNNVGQVIFEAYFKR